MVWPAPGGTPPFVDHRRPPDRFSRTATSGRWSPRLHEMKPGIGRGRRRSRWLIAAGVAALAAAGAAASCAALGGRATGARLQRMQRAPEWQGSHFVNPQPSVDDTRGAIVTLFKP